MLFLFLFLFFLYDNCIVFLIDVFKLLFFFLLSVVFFGDFMDLDRVCLFIDDLEYDGLILLLFFFVMFFFIENFMFSVMLFLFLN